MMKSRRLMTVAFAIVVATFAGIAGAADRLILGSRLFVSDTSGLEAARKVTIDGKESPSDIVSLSNPTLSGATLTVIANGGTSSNETYILDPQGWTANPTGYKYKGPTGGDGDPVRSATLRRSSAGAVQLRIQLKGNVGVQDLKVVPPYPGDSGGAILAVVGGDRYCVTFGQGAGGNESRDSALQWKIHGAAAQPGCPSVPTTTTTTVAGPTTTTTTTLPGPSPLCPMDSTRTIFAGGPGTSACHQYDNNPTACEQAFHIGGECGAASCYMDPSGNCNGCGPNNEDNGACVNTCVRGGPSCPGDPSRTLFAGYAGTSACTYLSFSQALCEKAYQINGEGQPSSCFFDGFDCRGCGPNNLDAELCQNTCPVCEGDNTRTTFLGGPGNSGCHKFDASQSSCEGAFLMGDSGAYTSCYYDSDNSQCNGCGPNNQSNGECINSCPVCADPGHSIFVGGPGTSACSIFSGNPTLCEQAFHVSGQCNELASCFYDFNYGDCLGCGPYNQGTGLCGNACAGPSCGNGIIDVAGEQCDGPIGCGVDELCSSACQCVSCSSTTIPAAGGVVTGTTFGLSAAASQCGYGTETAPEAVFAWTPNTTGYATIDACGSDFDTVMYLRVGSCGGTEDGCNDDGSCGVTSLLTPYVFAGTTYFIFLDGYYGNSGDFTLTVTPASPSGAFLDDVF